MTYDSAVMSKSVVHSGWIAEVMNYGKINMGNDVGDTMRISCWGWGEWGLSPPHGGGAGDP